MERKDAMCDKYRHLVVTICTTRFNIQQFYVLPTQFVNVFCVDLRTNSDYRISRPIRRTFSPEKCDLNSTCVLCAEGKMEFYMKKVTHRVKTTMKMILVAVTTIFWVSVMNKLRVYYGC
jgi:hypothetical protein